MSHCQALYHCLHYWNTTLAKVSLLYCYLMQYSKLFMYLPKVNFWQMHWCNLQFKSFYGMTIDVKRICAAYSFSHVALHLSVTRHSIHELNLDFSLTENYYHKLCVFVSCLKPCDDFSNIQFGYISFIEIITFYSRVWNTYCGVDYHT